MLSFNRKKFRKTTKRSSLRRWERLRCRFFVLFYRKSPFCSKKRPQISSLGRKMTLFAAKTIWKTAIPSDRIKKEYPSVLFYHDKLSLIPTTVRVLSLDMREDYSAYRIMALFLYHKMVAAALLKMESRTGRLNEGSPHLPMLLFKVGL